MDDRVLTTDVGGENLADMSSSNTPKGVCSDEEIVMSREKQFSRQVNHADVVAQQTEASMTRKTDTRTGGALNIWENLSSLDKRKLALMIGKIRDDDKVKFANKSSSFFCCYIISSLFTNLY